MSGVLFERFHGAATRVAPEATAFTHRTPGFNFLVAGQWLEPAETDATASAPPAALPRAAAAGL